MNEHSISQVHLQDEESLWNYYNKCGLSPALKILDSGPLDYKKTTYSLGDMFICSTTSTSGWGFEKQNNTDVYFVTYTHSGESIWELNKHGRIQASQQLCIVDSSRLVQGEFTRGTYTDTIMIDAKALNKELELSKGLNYKDRLEFQPLLNSDSQVWPMLNSIIKCIRNGMLFHKAQESPLAIRHLKQALMSTLIELIPHNNSNENRFKFDLITPRHISRAIEYMHAHAHEDISISDVAAYACTSVRNLQLGFKTFRNVSPMQYLRNVRLAGAHEELVKEDVRTDWQGIALRWGFVDLGLFAKYYKKNYGRTPFQTQHIIKGNLLTKKD
ncbi:AraC family transcriptional regulator [Pseudomonas citrulli]|uniref:AraC family transcriptional regulator n=1 Tax=Pseudomonas citrulli TaxID=3064347 RepID=UPI003ABDFDC2